MFSSNYICTCATGNPEGLGPELLETLVKMAPTKEEEIKLRDYKGDLSKLGSAERFLTAILDVPFAFKRVEVMLYRANFDTEIKYLRDSFKTLQVPTDSTSSFCFHALNINCHYYIVKFVLCQSSIILNNNC